MQYCVGAYVCVSVLVVHINVVLHIEFVVPVTIIGFNYYVTEDSCVNVAMRTIGPHDFNFTVFLIMKDSECQSVMYSITVHSMLLSCCASCINAFQLHNLSQF